MSESLVHKMDLQGESIEKAIGVSATLTNNVVFARVMEDKEIFIPIIESIIGEKVSSAVMIDGQARLSADNRVMKLHKVIYEVISEVTGKVINVSIQIGTTLDSVYRARLYNSLLDKTYGFSFNDAGRPFPDSYVIFLQKGDILGENRPIYRFTMKEDYGAELNDGHHIVFVNYLMYNIMDDTELSRLCEILATGNSNSIFGEMIQDRIDDLLENEHWKTAIYEYGAQVSSDDYCNDIRDDIEEVLITSVRGMKSLGISEGIIRSIFFDQINKLDAEQRSRILALIGR